MTPQYFAGLFEGEGNARIARSDRSKKERNGKTYYYRSASPVIQMSMTDPEPIYALRDAFGGNVNTTGRTSKGKTVYHWTASCRIAQKVAAALLPHCLCHRKKQQLELIINHYEVVDKLLRGRKTLGYRQGNSRAQLFLA
jgi:ribosomal protein S19E (S16A)